MIKAIAVTDDCIKAMKNQVLIFVCYEHVNQTGYGLLCSPFT